ncbi:hypothetical protein [Marinobacterium rhizophilum]|uniref:hypothetical protein n=1 Tax=Marinobacterium rhizophilum TaxID=420402 RepID=UPI000370B235|nr:hypothetical protein [Marinobacterium rhizophilum]
MAVEALEWISSLLIEKEIPFAVCGGLAAIGYGSTRPLNDIDIFVPGKYFQMVVSAGSEHISKPAKHYIGEGWDLEYVQFIYQGTKIEVGNAEGVRIFDAAKDQWVPLTINFSHISYVAVLGVDVPLMWAKDLINYKRVLDRKVDREDIEAIEPHA